MEPLKQKKPKLLIDYCNHKAALFACKTWHYSKALPAGKSVKFGVWEDDKFIGCIIFSLGANYLMSSKFGLTMNECCELTRIALTKHKTPVSKIGAVCLKKLRKKSKGTRLVVSYADPKQGHNGSIYQAMNFLYVGTSTPNRELIIDGKFTHKRSAFAKYGTGSPEKISKMIGKPCHYAPKEWKHTYLYPFDKSLKFETKPFPKRAISKDSVASVFHAEEGGAIPTMALHKNDG